MALMLCNAEGSIAASPAIETSDGNKLVGEVNLPILTEDTDARVRRTQVDTDSGSHLVCMCVFALIQR